MAVWVALLRGVNVGGHNRVNMPGLRQALTEAGFEDVQTYVASGNVIARSGHRSAEEVEKAVRATVSATFGLDVPVVVRTPRQLRDLLDWCPFPEAAERPTRVHVIYLGSDPNPEGVAALLAADWSPDRVEVRGREVVIRYDDSMHTSRLQHASVLKRLAVDGTARNWRTAQALVTLTSVAP
jgi:uncharacterized protein (DUF1697 family)